MSRLRSWVGSMTVWFQMKREADRANKNAGSSLDEAQPITDRLSRSVLDIMNKPSNKPTEKPPASKPKF